MQMRRNGFLLLVEKHESWKTEDRSFRNLDNQFIDKYAERIQNYHPNHKSKICHPGAQSKGVNPSP